MKKRRILILGGKGYLGVAVSKELKAHLVATYGREPGNTYQGSILNAEKLQDALKGKDVVINLVGLTPLREPKHTSYRIVHVTGVRTLIGACKQAKVKRVIHISAIGATPDGETEYLRTKGEAEELLLASGLDVTILRPSLILDWENELVKTVVKTARYGLFPVIPAHVQPIIRQDVARLVALAAEGKIRKRTLDVAGSKVLTIQELVAAVRKEMGAACWFIPFPLVRLGVTAAALLHLGGITADQVVGLTMDNATEQNDAAKYLTLTSVEEWLAMMPHTIPEGKKDVKKEQNI